MEKIIGFKYYYKKKYLLFKERAFYLHTLLSDRSVSQHKKL